MKAYLKPLLNKQYAANHLYCFIDSSLNIQESLAPMSIEQRKHLFTRGLIKYFFSPYVGDDLFKTRLTKMYHPSYVNSRYNYILAMEDLNIHVPKELHVENLHEMIDITAVPEIKYAMQLLKSSHVAEIILISANTSKVFSSPTNAIADYCIRLKNGTYMNRDLKLGDKLTLVDAGIVSNVDYCTDGTLYSVEKGTNRATTSLGKLQNNRLSYINRVLTPDLLRKEEDYINQTMNLSSLDEIMKNDLIQNNVIYPLCISNNHFRDNASLYVGNTIQVFPINHTFEAKVCVILPDTRMSTPYQVNEVMTTSVTEFNANVKDIKNIIQVNYPFFVSTGFADTTYDLFKNFTQI